MPRAKKPLPLPKPGYIYENSISRFIVLKVDGARGRRYVHVYTTMSGRRSRIRADAFLSNYALRTCKIP